MRTIKLYQTKHSRYPFTVVYSDPEKREKNGRAKRPTKYFSTLQEAEKYRDELEGRISLVGTAGLVLDERGRVDYLSARQKLDFAGHAAVTLNQLVDKFLALKPNAEKSPLLSEMLEKFLEKKREKKRSPLTVLNLEVRLKRWFEGRKLVHVADISKDEAHELADQAGGNENVRNNMAAASSFCSYLVNHRPPLLEANPFLRMERPSAGRTGRPAIFTPEQVEKLLNVAAEYAGGIYLPSFVLLLANLRPSEVVFGRIIYTGEPCVRVEGEASKGEGGKLKGMANRTVPLWPAALEWLNVAGAPSSAIRLPDIARQRICELAGIKWVPDICRHSAISYRLEVLKNVDQVALEAATSKAVIFRRYHRLVEPGAAVAFYRIAPTEKTAKPDKFKRAQAKRGTGRQFPKRKGVKFGKHLAAA